MHSQVKRSAILETQSAVAWRPGRWQYNLRGLMFLTFVIALVAAAARISVVLGIVLVPIWTMALVRTVRVMSVDRHRTTGTAGEARLSTTFVRSLWIVVSLLLVSLLTAFCGALSGALVALEAIARVLRVGYVVLRACVWRWWRFTRRACETAEAIGVRLQLRAGFSRTRREAVRSLVALARRDRRLMARFWLTADHLAHSTRSASSLEGGDS